ncbi:vanadium-dependent haloperoxidase [Actinoplanes sp. NPDC051411]|uniref:vanadium-dependent haloperoxidase n=1 Tax=Actinoplanes sp. NPDC051411 TaxID=3155522 RepID=UPI0034359C3D
MKRRDLLVATAAAAVLPAPVRSSGGRPPNAALYFSGIAETVIAPGRPPGSAGVFGGIVNGAIHDAGAAAGRRFRPLLGDLPSARGGDVDAAVAAAAYTVLAGRLPAQATVLAEAYESYRALLPGTREVRRGLATGRAVAEEILRRRADDGFDAVVPWAQPAPGPGVFEPVVSNPDGTPATPVDVKLVGVRPLLMASPRQFRPAGPNGLTSAAYTADWRETDEYGRIDSTRRSAAQTETVQFWAENPYTQWSRTLRGLAADRGLGTEAAARMLGVVQIAAADALIGCFDAKYHFLFWRPVHAIGRAGTDGNPATTADPTWRSLLVVNHPEYPSAHASLTTAVTTALAAHFGTTRVPLTMTSTVTGTTRTYRRLTEPGHEVSGARVRAGLHFRKSMIDGARLGRRAAKLVTGRAGSEKS